MLLKKRVPNTKIFFSISNSILKKCLRLHMSCMFSVFLCKICLRRIFAEYFSVTVYSTLANIWKIWLDSLTWLSHYNTVEKLLRVAIHYVLICVTWRKNTWAVETTEKIYIIAILWLLLLKSNFSHAVGKIFLLNKTADTNSTNV